MSTPTRERRWRVPLPVEFYRSAVGKKWVMAVTGIVLLGYILAHLLGNLKIYFGPEEINHYGEALRDLGGALVPRTHLLWLMRFGLIAAFGLHIHAAYSLTRINLAARRGRYAERDYLAANYASRTMRWSGIIVGLFVLFHLADLTWGTQPAATDEFFRGDVYGNIVSSFERPWVAAVYIVSQVALAFHIWHGTWSLFQTMGWNHPRFNKARRYFAAGFTGLILIGNLSFPIAVLTGIIS